MEKMIGLAKLSRTGKIVSGLALAVSLSVSTPAFSEDIEYPSNCEFSSNSDTNTSQVDIETLKLAYGLVASGNPVGVTVGAILMVGSFQQAYDYVRIEGPSRVIRGKYTRFKGNLFDPYSNIRFHTAEHGYVGKNKTNYEANAYRYLKFDEAYGPSFVWITNNGMCSAAGVWVQDAPTINFTYNGGLSATIEYSVDEQSIAYLQNDPIEITVQQSGNLLYSHTIPAGEKSGRVDLTNFYFGDNVRVVAEFSDGYFNATDSIYTERKDTRSMSGACRAACPASLGIHQGQCKGTTPVCK